MEALGLKKGTNGRVNNIETLVMLFCERETYRIQNFDANVYQIDQNILKSFGSRDSLAKLWEVTYDVILERLTRKHRRKRTSIANAKLMEWVECPDPELSLNDLAEFSRSRIEDLDELIRKINRRNGGVTVVGAASTRNTGGLPY